MKKTLLGIVTAATVLFAGMPFVHASVPADTTEPTIQVMATPPPQDPFCGFVDTGWTTYYSESVCWLKEQQITNGIGPEFYGPMGNVTRAQMAAFLWRKAGSPVVQNYVFADEANIPVYARVAADWLKTQGITTNDPYRPNALVTRGEMAAFLWRTAGRPASPTSCGFIDAGAIPSWAQQGACWLKSNSITNNNPYNPTNNVTRAQMSAFLWREAGKPAVSKPAANALVLWVNTRKGDKNVDLGLGAGNVSINWGDGTSAQTTTGNKVVRHTYAQDGYYRIVITGTLAELGGYENANNYELPELIAVPQFGNIGITSLGYAFTKAPNLARVSRHLPGVVDTLEGTFSGAVKPNPCRPGNPCPLLPSASPSVLNNYRMYEYLGEDISQWDTSQIEDFSWTFAFESEFNEDISGWDTSSATNMESMFLGAYEFNQDISGWDVSNVTDMSAMFAAAKSFNQDISGWDVSNVTDMSGMFEFTEAFQVSLSPWNTGKVTDATGMFQFSLYNADLSGWTFGPNANLSQMFQGSSFNGNVSNWNMTNVSSTELMFAETPAFNQDISSWRLNSVTNMSSMFNTAAIFNQDLSSWTIPSSVNSSGYDKDATNWVLPRPTFI
jgi:surface protein